MPSTGILSRMLSRTILIIVINPRMTTKTAYSSGQRLIKAIVYGQKAPSALWDIATLRTAMGKCIKPKIRATYIMREDCILRMNRRIRSGLKEKRTAETIQRYG